MASTSICTSCLRALRSKARKDLLFNPIATQPYISSTTRTLALLSRHEFSTSTPSLQKKPAPSPAPPPPPPKGQPDTISKFAAQLRKSETFKSATEPYVAYGASEDLYKECNKQCDYTIPSRLQKPPPEEAPKNAAGEDIGVSEAWWFQPKQSGGLGLDVTFSNWTQIMFLHMYMLEVRIRCFPAEHVKIWRQNLLDHFFYAAEDRMVTWHAMTSRGKRNQHLKDLFQLWRGNCLSYDEGLIKGDAVMATAIWRNLFKASVETDIGDLALVTVYMRSQLRMLDKLSDERVTGGDVHFGGPREMRSMAEEQSPRMRQKVGEDELNAVQQQIPVKE